MCLLRNICLLGILPLQCPDGTWICQTSTSSGHSALTHAHNRLAVSNRRPLHDSEEPRVLQVVPVAGAMHLPNVTHYRGGVNVTAQLSPARDNSKCEHLEMRRPRPIVVELMLAQLRSATVLHVRLHGGHDIYGSQKADFQFVCDRSVDEVRLRQISATYLCVLSFSRRHSHQHRHTPGRGTGRTPSNGARSTPAAHDLQCLPPRTAHPRAASETRMKMCPHRTTRTTGKSSVAETPSPTAPRGRA